MNSPSRRYALPFMGGLILLGLIVFLIPAFATAQVTLPARIQAEDYDDESGTYTTTTNDVDGDDDLYLLWIGDWASYEVTIPDTANYTITIRARGNMGDYFRIEIDDEDVTGTVGPDAAGVYVDVVVQNVELPAGNHTLKYYQVNGWGWDSRINWIEVTAENSTPTVDAGSNQTVTYPSSATLDGTVSDDGLPNPPASVTTTWTKQSGPGTVTFGSTSSVDTTAAFSASGTYVLRLTADDSSLSDYDDVTIEVNAAPSVDAGSDQTVTYPSNATLDGTVTDDGLPSSPGSVTTTWTKQSGPGTVMFGNSASVDTTAAFSASGTYVLRLTADDDDTTDYDEVTIEVNAAPTVNAGLDDTITLTSGATLDATVSDDGLPSTPGTYTVTWTKQSGPGTVTFGNASAVDTTADFDTVGTYVLRLTADDDDTTAYDDVQITVESGSFSMTIQAEDYDDDSGAGVIETDDVDGGDDLYCMWIGDWTEYNINIPSSGNYDITIRARGSVGDYFRIEIDDEDVTGTIGPDTQGVYVDVVAEDITLTSGNCVLKYYQVNGWGWDCRINWIKIESDGAASNTTPTVEAGSNETITWPTAQVSLDGTVSDDGLPNPPGAVTTTWTKQSGPGTVTFGNSAAVETTASFSASGTYVLRLIADDSALTDYDEVTIVVNAAPTVDAGVDQCIAPASATATLDATVSDDGLPSTPGSVTTTWTMQSGPGTVTFGNASAVDTTATFSVAGTYVLRLTADDGDAQTTDDVTIGVSARTTLPAKLQAEDYRYGGSALGYYDTTSGNAGGQYRSDDVDIYDCTDTGDGYEVRRIVEDEWLTFDVNVPSTDTYDIGFRVKTDGVSRDLHIEIDGSDVTGTVSVTSSTTYGTTTKENVSLASGDHVLKVVFEETWGSTDALNWIEITPDNTAPTVNAGIDKNVDLPSNASLDATVTDDGLPNPPASVTVTWTKQSGPGTVTFGSASSVDTTAAFSASGTYVLRLTADDSDETTYDDVTVWANSVPTVDVGADQNISFPNNATLDATVTDDGLPNPPGTYTVLWTKQSGAGTVTFGNSAAVDTTAAFSVSGSYVLRLTADDGSLQTYDELTITANSTPIVSAGSNQTVTYPSNATLDGTVSDDGLPNPPGSVTTTWTKQSGPGTVTFGNTSSVDTTAAFSASGTYILRLTADDGSLTDYDDVTIEANAAPNVDAGSNQTVTYPSSATLDGTVTDDGLPSSPGSVTTTWTKQSGPGTVMFGNSASVDTTAAFSASGTYVLRLTADDDDTTDYDEVTITVNGTPNVDAGLDDTIFLTSSATLDATVTDDGLPNPPAAVTTTWTKQSGPGTATFGNASAVDTTVTFDTVGTYVLRLTADDDDTTGYDEVQITVAGGSPTSVTFSVTSYSAGDGAWAIDAGNFDSDSDVDLVAANLGDGDASVFLNNGDGSFATKSDYGAGTSARSVGVGDFDEDGYRDFAVVNNGDNDVSILLNDQDGTFGTKTDYSTGTGCSSVVVDDFDKDGNLDLAVSRTSGNKVEILMGNGDGSFDTGIEYSVANVSYSVATGYFDSDSYPDLVLSNAYGSTAIVLLNDGNGTFGSYSTYATDGLSYAAATGDFDEDGYDDIVVACATTDVVSVLINDQDGTFGTNTDYAVGDSPRAVTTADFNWDGHLDIAVANYTDSDVSVLLGNGDGTFGTKTDYAVGSYPQGITAADLNNDSKTDLATANSGSDNISVLLNTSSGSGNTAPLVDAGSNQTVTYPSSATLDATVSDDGLPNPPGACTVTWTKQSGPGTVTFGNSAAVDTTASFSASGTYVLRLTADDGDLTDYDEVTIVVNAVPTVDAGSNDSITWPTNTYNLDGTVNDDGLPNPPASVTTTWTMQSGPGTVTFSNASAVDTTATFSTYGTYVLRLTADDDDATNYDEVQITVSVSQSNQTPVVNAGLDDFTTLSGSVTLDATVSDDGLPNPPATVTTTWTMQSGPGTVTFANSSAVDTTASFSTTGTYVLRLTADDNDLTNYDELTVVVVSDSTFILPTRIEAEDYREGGQNVGYYDTSSGNWGNVYRTDDVDIDVCTDTGGGYAVAWIVENEWLSYDIYVPTTNKYTLTFRTEANVKAFHVEVDGENITGTLQTFTLGGYDDTVVNDIELEAGAHVLKVVFHANWGTYTQFNYIDITAGTPPEVDVGSDQTITLPENSYEVDATVTEDGTPNPPGEYTVRWTVTSGPESAYVNFNDKYAVDTTVTFDTAGVYVLRLTADDSESTGYDEIQITVNESTGRVTLPGRLEAEDYSDQGEGISYHDTTAGNAGSVYRSDDVDIESCSDSGGGYDVYTIADGEWLAFRVEVPSDTACYDIVARVNSSTSSRQMHVEVDGVDVTGAMTFDSTGGWTDVTAEGVHLTAGPHTVKVVMDTGDFSLNYVDMVAETYEEYIIENNTANADIVISNSAPRSVILAADELQSILEDITGATLPIVTTQTGADVHVYVGQSSYTDSLGISTSGLEYEGYKIVTGSNWMALIGADTDYTPIYPYGGGTEVEEDWDDLNYPYLWDYPYAYATRTYAYDSELDIWLSDGKGSLNAVYAFLYDLGCRWYFPGAAYEIIPDLDNIGLPGGNRTVEPDFPFREWFQYYTEFARANNADEVRWQLRMGLNDGRETVGNGPRGHGIQHIVGREEYHTLHPTYYAIWNGERQFDYMGGTPCLSSTGLLAENVEFIETLFDHYNEPMVNVSPSDGYWYLCECASCEGKEDVERGDTGRLSDYVFAYVDDLASEVYLTHPVKKVSCLAYTTYYQPPQDIETMSSNLVITFCRWRSWFEDPDMELLYQDGLHDWMEKLPNDQFFIWDYYLHARPPVDDFSGIPVYYPWIIRDDLRLLNGKSLGDYIEVQRNWPAWGLTYHALAANHLNLYITARLYWNAEEDVNTLLEEYYTKFYGDAADEMKTFVEYCEANWLQAAIDRDGSSDYTRIEQMRTHLNAAISAASGVYADRVDLVNDFLAVGEEE